MKDTAGKRDMGNAESKSGINLWIEVQGSRYSAVNERKRRFRRKWKGQTERNGRTNGR